MTAAVLVAPPEPPPAWNDPMLLVYPNGGTARFDPRGRFYRAGDVINGYVVDRFELDSDRIVAVLRMH